MESEKGLISSRTPPTLKMGGRLPNNRSARTFNFKTFLFFSFLASVAVFFTCVELCSDHFQRVPVTTGPESLSYVRGSPQALRNLVPLEAHIISKCPDTRDCLQELLLPVMELVSAKVNFTLSYIGTPLSESAEDVECKHGPMECMGNILELCAARLYPDPKQYLGFVMCLTRDYEDIPERALLEDCALEHGLDFERLNHCASTDDGGLGMGYLRESVKRSMAAGVDTSCTVRLNGETYCVHDDGEWTDCPAGPAVNDLVARIEKLYYQGPLLI
jgi:hypothetical protein